jgi:hypothetical protein
MPSKEFDSIRKENFAEHLSFDIQKRRPSLFSPRDATSFRFAFRVAVRCSGEVPSWRHSVRVFAQYCLRYCRAKALDIASFVSIAG